MLAEHDTLKQWELPEASAANAKYVFITKRVFPLMCTEYFSGFEALLDRLREFLWGRVQDACDALDDVPVPMPGLEWSVEDRLQNAKKDYDNFLRILTEFIENIRSDASEQVSTSIISYCRNAEVVSPTS